MNSRVIVSKILSSKRILVLMIVCIIHLNFLARNKNDTDEFESFV